MKTKRLLSLLITIFLLIETGTGNAYAAFSKGDAGTSTAQFLKLGAGARASGMGNAYSSLCDDADAVYWNPAGMRGVGLRSLSFMHVPWMEDISYDWVSYVQDLEEAGTIGFGIQYMSYGSVDETNEVGAKVGTVSPSDTALTASYARDLIYGVLQGGASLKYISTKLKNSADAVAMDLGTTYWVPDTTLSLALVISNIGTGMKFVQKDSPLPSNIKIGSAYDVTENWLVSTDIVLPNDNDHHFAMGTEYKYNAFAFRTGYNTRTSDIGGLAGLSMGIGFKYKDFRFDYSYEFYDFMGDVHRFSVVWKSFRY